MSYVCMNKKERLIEEAKDALNESVDALFDELTIDYKVCPVTLILEMSKYDRGDPKSLIELSRLLVKKVTVCLSCL